MQENQDCGEQLNKEVPEHKEEAAQENEQAAASRSDTEQSASTESSQPPSEELEGAAEETETLPEEPEPSSGESEDAAEEVYDASVLESSLQQEVAEILKEDAADRKDHPKRRRPEARKKEPWDDPEEDDGEEDEERQRRSRFQLRVIIALLAAGILACAVLMVILAVRPDVIFDRPEQVTVTQTQETQTQEEAQEEQEQTAAQAEEETDDSLNYVGLFELPIEGTTGYAPVDMSVVDEDGAKVASLEAGEAYVILGYHGKYLRIETRDGVEGLVPQANAWVNLPDVIPSIIYYDANSDSSLFASSGYNLPGITGEKLYNSLYMNERFGEEQYCMPVLYEMAVKIMKIQQVCLANGESLKIYQTFRPYETQMEVAAALKELEAANEEVYAGLNDGSWSDTWFIATKLSNHQRGCAIDVSLVQVDASEVRTCGEYEYTAVTEYTEYPMPSDMHELSYRAAVFDPPVSSSNDTAWRSATYAETMTVYAYRLLDYCTSYGLSPLSSEWWHFNDLEAKSDAGSSLGTGKFYLEECLSRVPE